MTTRLYLGNAAGAVTPTTIRGAWDAKTLTGVSDLSPVPVGTAATAAAAETTTTTNWDVLLRRWVSDPFIVDGTLSGTMNWSFGALESSSTMSARTHLHVFILRGTDTLVGTLVTDYASSTTWPTTAAARSESGRAITSTDFLTGDRIVVELGYRAVNTSSTSFTGTINYGNTGTTDLAGTNANVTTRPGWVEFSGLDGLMYPEISSIKDSFSTGSLDMTLWGGSYGTPSLPTVVNGRARIPCVSDGAGGAVYCAIATTATNYHFADDGIYCQLPTVPSAGGGVGETYVQFAIESPTAGTGLRCIYYAASGLLSFESTVSYSDASPTQITYDPVNHLYVKMSHAAGVVTFATSPDNVTYTTQRTIATAPSWCNYSALYLIVEASRTDGTNDYAEADQVGTLDQTVTGTGIPSGEALGVASASIAVSDQTVTGTGISSAETFGVGDAVPGQVTVAGTGIATGETFGFASAAAASSGTGIPSSEALGVGTLTTLTALVGTGVPTGERLGTGALSQTLQSTGIGSSERFGQGTTSLSLTGTGVQTVESFGVASFTHVLAGTGITSQEQLGSGTSVIGASGTGVATSERFGVGATTTGSVTLAGTGIPRKENFGQGGDAQVGASLVEGTGISSQTRLGSGAVSVGPVTLSGTGVTSAAALVGVGTVSPGPVTASATGITTSQAFGVGSLTQSLTGTGIGSSERFGVAALLADQTVTGTGIVSQVAIGTAAVGVQLNGTGIPSTARLGIASVSLNLFAVGIASSERFGRHIASAGPVTLFSTGIPSAVAFGVGEGMVGATVLLGTGIPKQDRFGWGVFTTGPVTLTGTSIPAQEKFGWGFFTVIGPPQTLYAVAIGPLEMFGLGNAHLTPDVEAYLGVLVVGASMQSTMIHTAVESAATSDSVETEETSVSLATPRA